MKVLRLDRKFREVHVWDTKTFSDRGYPIATCGTYMYPRSPLMLVTHKELNQKKICGDCNKPGRSRSVARKKKGKK